MRCNLIFLLVWIYQVIGETKVADFDGRVCAFADFDSDRNTDILMVRNGNLTISLQETKLWEVLEPLKFVNSTSWKIGDPKEDNLVECATGDFDGDSRIDVLVSIRRGNNQYKHTLYISRISNGIEEFDALEIDEILAEPAMSIDINSDGFSDIVGFLPNGSLYCSSVDVTGMILTDCSKSFNSFPIKLTNYEGMPHLFVDINGDLRADIVFMTKDSDGSLVMRVFQQQKIGWVEKTWIPKLSIAQYAFVGAPIPMDYDGDGMIDLLVPICRELACTHVTSLASYSFTKGWSNVAIDMQELEIIRADPYSRVLFRVGDYFANGFPDLLTVVYSSNIENKTRTKSVKLIQNTECKNCEKNGTRKFEFSNLELVQTGGMAIGSIDMAVFFDLLEDGKLDLLVEYKNVKHNGSSIGFMVNKNEFDTTFLKVQIFNGVCNVNCDDRTKDLGPGSTVTLSGSCGSFSMSDGWGGSSQSIQCQTPSTSYRTLNLPYLFFGLGRSPNFVDELNMGIPKYKDMKSQWFNSLKQIVPNSRIMVQPTESGHWLSRLYVTPSQLILQSILVITSVCGILLMVALFLHYREKKEDRYERQQQSHQFHFDAM
ncbi:unnamed protein product [Caenorhabditis angaria]|uniref:T-cell immunomodulatory protein TIP C2 domain-containing protein n=1 Tax=Caenorhabditis angaria TaxID=860376 RepID=A0A9P1N368_9PELO|nr:unnamed protein product [Caenorhabditis angaria]